MLHLIQNINRPNEDHVGQRTRAQLFQGLAQQNM